MVVGLFLMTGLTATTEQLRLWAWMFLTGLGIGPAFSVLTIVIQSVVPFQFLGVATGNLTFFRQIGGSVGLAIFGTLFANGFKDQLVPQLTRPACRRRRRPTCDPGQHRWCHPGRRGRTPWHRPHPASSRRSRTRSWQGIFEAFSLAVANAFWLGVIAGVIALVLVAVALPEVALRGMGTKSATESAPGGQPVVPVIAESILRPGVAVIPGWPPWVRRHRRPFTDEIPGQGLAAPPPLSIPTPGPLWAGRSFCRCPCCPCRAPLRSSASRPRVLTPRAVERTICRPSLSTRIRAPTRQTLLNRIERSSTGCGAFGRGAPTGSIPFGLGWRGVCTDRPGLDVEVGEPSHSFAGALTG